MVLRFGPGDAARCRFAVSPLQETMSALLVLRNRGRQAFYGQWLRSAAEGPDLGLLRLATPVHGHGPDFLWPTPSRPVGSVEDELAAVAATDPDVVARELAAHVRRLDRRTVPPDLHRVLIGDPVEARDRLVAQQREAWERLVAPLWERIRGLADADIGLRSRRLADAGVDGLFADLHPRATWQGDALHLTGFARDVAVDLRGRGLVLVPTAFGWPKLGVGPTSRAAVTAPALTYPMPGAGRLWEAAVPPPAIARLLGAGRALVLAETAVPATTTGLARRVGLAPATVSRHLAVLRDSGLVTAERRGREVFYRQTSLGAELGGSHRPA